METKVATLPELDGIFRRALFIGMVVGGAAASLTGAFLGLLAILVVAPVGMVLGALIGLANGAALALLTRCPTSRVAVRVTGAVISATCLWPFLALLPAESVFVVVAGTAVVAAIVAPRAAFGPDPRWIASVGWDALIGLIIGGVVGLVIGLVGYPLTAAAAAVEGGALGIAPGVLVGFVVRSGVHARRRLMAQR